MIERSESRAMQQDIGTIETQRGRVYAFYSDVRAQSTGDERFSVVLDLYKGWIDSNELGVAKQIKAYRDWVAHQNPKKSPSASVDPEAAYELLVSIVGAVQASGPGSLEPPS